MKNVFDTVTELPSNGGTLARRKIPAAQLPVEVPAKGAPTMALVARPLAAKVTETRPLPVGPPFFLQPDAEPAAEESAERAALTLNSPPPLAFFFFFFFFFLDDFLSSSFLSSFLSSFFDESLASATA
jgi:hypothetical protein